MDPAARRLAWGTTGLVLTDLVGGLLAVGQGVNTWSEAWGERALLAAPLPMVVGQVGLTVLSVRGRRRWAAVPAGLLTAACAVSVVSGFFDGGLGNDKLHPALVGYQVLLMAITAGVGALAAVRAQELLRSAG